MIVDSPGIGESDIMDSQVMQYLPEAIAFIYVINSNNAGGVQKDRVCDKASIVTLLFKTYFIESILIFVIFTI